MSVLIASSAALTCFGDADATVTAIRAGRCGVGPVRCGDPTRLGVAHGYHVDDPDPDWRASRFLSACVRDAIHAAHLDPARQRVAAIVGTGLRELRAVEIGANFEVSRLHFAGAVRAASPITEVYTIAGACSAGGHALALGQDMLELGDADAVVVAAADAMTESMLAMIGRVADAPTDRVRPFDKDRQGVLLGEGAAALVLVPEGGTDTPLARVLATGLSCDAGHETAPDPAGIARAFGDVFARAGRPPDAVDLVMAHGTGTALNDPTEALAIIDAFGARMPLVTAIKGAIGHTSGAAALHSLIVAIACLRDGVVPPIVGLRHPLPEAATLRLVSEPTSAEVRLVAVNSFGFGGVNAVSLVAAP